MAFIKRSLINLCMAGSLAALCLTGCGEKKAAEGEKEQFVYLC